MFKSGKIPAKKLLVHSWTCSDKGSTWNIFGTPTGGGSRKHYLQQVLPMHQRMRMRKVKMFLKKSLLMKNLPQRGQDIPYSRRVSNNFDQYVYKHKTKLYKNDKIFVWYYTLEFMKTKHWKSFKIRATKQSKVGTYLFYEIVQCCFIFCL